MKSKNWGRTSSEEQKKAKAQRQELKKENLGQEAGEAWPKRREPVWKQKRQVNYIRSQNAELGLREQLIENHWRGLGTGRTWGNWWFRKISLALVCGINWRLKGINKGNFVWYTCGCKTKGEANFTVLRMYKIRKDSRYTHYELVFSDTMCPTSDLVHAMGHQLLTIQFTNP